MTLIERLRSGFQLLLHDKRGLFALARYCIIGATVAGIDIGLLKLSLSFGASLFVATTIGYFIGVFSHFTMNRYLNFRDGSRSTFSQAQTYAVIVALSWLITLFVVFTVTHAGMPTIAAKVLSIFVNLPVGFLSHRYLTFGPGIIATVRRFMPGDRA